MYITAGYLEALESHIDAETFQRLLREQGISTRSTGLEDHDVTSEEDEGDVDDDETFVHSYFRRSQPPKARFKPATEPSDAGQRLLVGGEFGRIQPKLKSESEQRNVARLLLRRGQSTRRATML